LWDLPGGGVELGESHMDCIKREFKEETNLIVEVVDLKSVIVSDDKKIKVYIYNVELLDVNSKIKLGESHTEFDFVKDITKKDVIWYLKDYVFL